jgi:hypothetical protein
MTNNRELAYDDLIEAIQKVRRYTECRSVEYGKIMEMLIVAKGLRELYNGE